MILKSSDAEEACILLEIDIIDFTFSCRIYNIASLNMYYDNHKADSNINIHRYQRNIELSPCC